MAKANTNLESLQPDRHTTIIGGDFNKRPDLHHEGTQNGLEADPDCWYRGFSAAAAHPNGPCPARSDAYYDTVWLKEGGATTPAAPAICSQYTRKYFSLGKLTGEDNLAGEDLSTSCTDIYGEKVGPDGQLDKGRIDYLWVRWEDPSGDAWRPLEPQAAALIPSASADVGFDVTTGQAYSDHRAVSATILPPNALQ
ncbi:MAG: hypothetical protein M3198_08695 [Actinomycetota bacterium]|nr:hypothetical protein [Actinomycetota bacterium]